jgi:chemotaxis protein MotB
MARKVHHEEHVNAEAWAIPYGDLVTLLLAFFVVMYAVSSVNEGKYRVLADAMAEAFGGPPKTISPLQLGREQVRGSNQDQPVPVGMKLAATPVAARVARDFPQAIRIAGNIVPAAPQSNGGERERAQREQLARVGARIEQALKELIDQDMVVVRRVSLSLEIEIKTDILFGSGSAALNAPALDTLQRLAGIVRDGGNPVRIEGHTDDRPIRTYLFPSNWELSAARAASVVHLFSDTGVPAGRLSLMGWADQKPRADNQTDAGRAANRRVVIVVMADAQPGDPAVEGVLANGPSARSAGRAVTVAAPQETPPPRSDAKLLAVSSIPSSTPRVLDTRAAHGTLPERARGASPRGGAAAYSTRVPRP